MIFAHSKSGAEDAAVQTLRDLRVLPSNDGFRDAHELVRMVRRETDSFEPTVFSLKQNMAAQIAIIQFDAPNKSPASTKNGRPNLDFQDFPRGNDDGVK
jgi:hypothetical protein